VDYGRYPAVSLRQAGLDVDLIWVIFRLPLWSSGRVCAEIVTAHASQEVTETGLLSTAVQSQTSRSHTNVHVGSRS